jgi:pyruvate formate lyase activating enzyme
MIIFSLEKLSLIDYPGKLASTIFLFGCNFRCPFCHNPELVIAERANSTHTGISQEKILEFLKERKKYLDGVCITGGEPLINSESEIRDFFKKIKLLGYSIKLDTNGTNPALLGKLISEQLVDYVSMDIKSDKENYNLSSGKEVDMQDIEESIKILINSEITYEFRTTLVPTLHNKKIVENIAKWLKELTNRKIKNYCLQRFIPRENKMIESKFEKIKPFTEEEMKEFQEISNKYIKTDLRS